MTERKSKTTLFLVLLVIAVSAATSWATNFVQNKSNDVEYIESSSPSNQDVKARFASAQRAFETDFTVAAELTVHAVVHVKTKAPRQQRGGDMCGDPFFEFFFGPGQRGQQQQQQDNKNKDQKQKSAEEKERAKEDKRQLDALQQNEKNTQQKVQRQQEKGRNLKQAKDW